MRLKAPLVRCSPLGEPRTGCGRCRAAGTQPLCCPASRPTAAHSGVGGSLSFLRSCSLPPVAQPSTHSLGEKASHTVGNLCSWQHRRGWGANRTWLSDISRIAAAENWLCLAAVVDLRTRRVVGWAMHRQITAGPARAAPPARQARAPNAIDRWFPPLSTAPHWCVRGRPSIARGHLAQCQARSTP